MVKNIFALIGCVWGLGVSLFIFVMAEDMNMTLMREAGITGLIYSGLAIIGFLVSGKAPRLGGFLMALGGMVIMGTFDEIARIAGLLLMIAGIISMFVKKNKISNVSNNV